MLCPISWVSEQDGACAHPGAMLASRRVRQICDFLNYNAPTTHPYLLPSAGLSCIAYQPHYHGTKWWATHQSSSINGSHSRLQLSIKVSQTSVRRQIRLVHLVKIASESVGIKFKTVWSNPHGQLEGIDISPQTGHVS